MYKTIFWFSFIGFLRPAINVFLIPLYLACISPEEYGLLSLVLIFSAIIGMLLSKHFTFIIMMMNRYFGIISVKYSPSVLFWGLSGLLFL